MATLLEDMHVHSVFSDGRDTVADNVQEAESLGLERICCVDHVRRSTSWVPEFVREVGRVGAQSSIDVLCGVEAKILDGDGTLDLPAHLDGVDFVLAADHQFPLGKRCYQPRIIRKWIRAGLLDRHMAVESLVHASIRVMERNPGVVMAHLFSILRKVGLSEADVRQTALDRLAETAYRTGARIEIDERWRCPSTRSMATFADAGVEILSSSDSHKRETIGRYRHVANVLDQLGFLPRVEQAA
jgi:putative hydrolase